MIDGTGEGHLPIRLHSRMSKHATFDAIGAILGIFVMAHQFIRQAVEDVPQSRMTEQPGTARQPSRLDARALERVRRTLAHHTG